MGGSECGDGISDANVLYKVFRSNCLLKIENIFYSIQFNFVKFEVSLALMLLLYRCSVAGRPTVKFTKKNVSAND